MSPVGTKCECRRVPATTASECTADGPGTWRPPRPLGCPSEMSAFAESFGGQPDQPRTFAAFGSPRHVLSSTPFQSSSTECRITKIGMKTMLKFYYSGAPNPTKVALFLEESGLPYQAIPVDTRKGDQHKSEYLAINPNAKVPAIVDGDALVFDSNAILLYLAEKTGKFLPDNTPKARGEWLSWLMFVASGVGPYSGQAVHFRNYAPEKLPYAINRYAFE